ncbi:hypothetical protein ABPG72_011215 [Tetrahymena utriculariae]
MIESKVEEEICQGHQLKIEFICGVNEWHCETLCVECIPSHTQKHNTNKLPTNIKKINIVKQECQQKVDQYVQNLLKMKQDFRELVNKYPIDDENMLNLKKWRKQTIDAVNQTYDKFEADYISIYNSIYDKQKILFDQIFEVLKKEEEDFKPLYGTIQSLKQIRMTFKKNLEDRYKDILEKIKQAEALKVQEKLLFQQESMDKIAKTLPSLITSVQAQNQQKIKDIQQQKRKQIHTEKQHLCPECGNIMNYVSDFKKHLVCPDCVKVKRPNTLPHNKFGDIGKNKNLKN